MEGIEDVYLRLLLIGKTGNGKSTVGNILLGKPHFETGCSMLSTTVQPASGTILVNGRLIKVVDTPDISNLEVAAENSARQQVTLWKSLTSPGPHLILLVVRCDVRYTREEYQVYKQVNQLWGKDEVTRKLVVAFTFGDLLDKDLVSELKSVCAELKKVLGVASGRYLLFNNKATTEDKGRQAQAAFDMALKLDLPSASLTSSCDVLRLLLVGRSRTGKSSTGNTILGYDLFPVHRSQHTSDHDCIKGLAKIDDKTVEVIDTPGLQLGLTKDPHYLREKEKALNHALPGPHAILYVVRHKRVTRDDLQGFLNLQEQLGPGLSHHTIIVLVGARHADPRIPAVNKYRFRRGGSLGSHSPMAEECESVEVYPKPSESPEIQQPRNEGLFRARAGSVSDTIPPKKVARQDSAEGPLFDSLLQVAGNKLWIVHDNTAPTSTTNTPTSSTAPTTPAALGGSPHPGTAREEGEGAVGGRDQQIRSLMMIVQGILHNSGGRCFQGGATQVVGRANAMAEMEIQNPNSSKHQRGSCWFL